MNSAAAILFVGSDNEARNILADDELECSMMTSLSLTSLKLERVSNQQPAK